MGFGVYSSFGVCYLSYFFGVLRLDVDDWSLVLTIGNLDTLLTAVGLVSSLISVTSVVTVVVLTVVSLMVYVAGLRTKEAGFCTGGCSNLLCFNGLDCSYFLPYVFSSFVITYFTAFTLLLTILVGGLYT